MKQVLSAEQFLNRKLLTNLFEKTAKLQKFKPHQYPQTLKNRQLAVLFYEASTRTRLSCEAAIQKLGGQILTIENMANLSSVAKGENFTDTIKSLDGYADGFIIRHPEKGMVKLAADITDKVVINAGDGAGQHPTQALLDVYTIWQHLGKVDGLAIGIIGDILHSRTLHSLAQLISIYRVKLYLISPKYLRSPELEDWLIAHKVNFNTTSNWHGWFSKLDVLYINRIQYERHKGKKEIPVAKQFKLTPKEMKLLKSTAIVMSPLPRLDEIDSEIDGDPRAIYFKQVTNGLYVRMALLQYLFS